MLPERLEEQPTSSARTRACLMSERFKRVEVEQEEDSRLSDIRNKISSLKAVVLFIFKIV